MIYSLRCFLKSPSFGLFMLEASEVSISNLTLQWNHQFHPRHGINPVHKQPSPLLRIPKDFGAVDVLVELPRKSQFIYFCLQLIIYYSISVQLDAPQAMLLTVRSGRNCISSGSIKLPITMGIEFQTEHADIVVCGILIITLKTIMFNLSYLDGDAAVSFEEDKISMSNLEKDSQIQVRIPHAYHAGAEPLVCD